VSGRRHRHSRAAHPRTHRRQQRRGRAAVMGESEPDYASSAALAGLAGEVEQLRRRLEPVETLPARVQQLAAVVDGLADKVAHLSQRAQTTAVPSWLMAP